MSRKTLEYLKDIRKVLELAEKPEGSEFKNIFKLVTLGFIAVGGLSFGLSFLITTLLNMFGVGLQ
uniref:Protein translocase subunit SecE n=1 Tax=Ignisphaera aggregans TaxID=334771 RepID=A0A7C2VGY1_9CREN